MNTLQAFINILEQQLKGYQQLLDFAQEKQKMLIANDISGLDQLNKDEQRLLLELTKLEGQRLQIVQGLRELLGTDAPTMTLKEIAQSAAEPHQSKLHIIYQELDSVIAELDKVNQENSGLIKQALKYVNFTMDMLAKEEREVTYPQGEKGAKPQSRIFDQKV